MARQGREQDEGGEGQSPRGERHTLSQSASGAVQWVAIADIHGHLAHFEALLEYQHARWPEASVVTLGDYLDNGPDAPALLDRLIALKAERGEAFQAIAGNHDLACLLSISPLKPKADPRWFSRWCSNYWRPNQISGAHAYQAHSAEALCLRERGKC